MSQAEIYGYLKRHFVSVIIMVFTDYIRVASK
jgi:hypothetical protein